MPRNRWVVLVTLALALTSCTSGSKAPRATHPKPDPCPGSPVSLTPTAGAPSPLSGRVVLLAGESDLNADLYELTLPPTVLRRMTCEQRVSTVGGRAGSIVVAAAQRDVGYSDHIQQLVDDRLAPIDGLGLVSGFSPEVGPDSRIMFTQINGTKDAPRLDVNVFDPTTKVTNTVSSGDPNVLVGGVLGPDGKVAIGRHEASGDKLVILDRNGKQDILQPGVAKLGNFQWSDTGWIAMQDIGVGVVFFDPRSKQRVAVPGWQVLGWSPDGAGLLVAGGDHQKTLGIAKPSAGPAVQPVIELPHSVFGAVWFST
jgi:hypothetical protein